MENKRKRVRIRQAVVFGILFLGTGMAAGCGNVPHVEALDEAPVVRIGISGSSGVRQNMDQVNCKLEEASIEKIGVKVQLVATGQESGDNDYKNRQMGLDIYGMYYNTYCSCVQKHLLLELSGYLKDAPALRQVLEEKAVSQDLGQEGIYGIPKPLSDLHSSGALLNRELVKRYQMNVSAVRQPEDLEPFFDVIMRYEPDVIPWALEKRGNAVLERSPIADILDGCLAGILYEDNAPVVCNVFETRAYEESCYLAKRWQEKGYLAKDVLTCIEAGKNLVVAGDAFAAECVIKPDETQYDESIFGEQVIIIPFEKPPVLDTEDDWVYVWGISAGTKYPREAVKALDLLYSDPEILNLILYGAEGEHYEVQGDGSFCFQEGETHETAAYFNPSKWKFNTLKAGVWNGMSHNLEEEFLAFQDSAVRSAAYGFWLDESRITVDLGRLRQIVNTYTPRLKVGLCDTEDYLKEFHRRLREAGSEQLVYEVQQQLDEWKMTEKVQ